jgi:hypothetical protein
MNGNGSSTYVVEKPVDDVIRIIANPLCIWRIHCGGMARIGVAIRNAAGTCEHRTIDCLKCGRRVGLQSRNLEAR